MNEKNFHLTKHHVIPHVTTTWLAPETTDLITKQIKETKSRSIPADSLEFTFSSPQPVDTECKC